jgi:hypothetical protein
MLLDNANPKKNPVTTLLGAVFMTISATMYCIKYILPAFIELKAVIPYEWHTPLWPLGLGLLLLFMNERYFDRMFNKAEGIVSKKTNSENDHG